MRFPIHRFSTFERIRKYDENENAGNVGKPYFIELFGTPGWINLYAAADADIYYNYEAWENELV